MQSGTAKFEQGRNRWAYIWLAYTGFIFIDPIMEPRLSLWLGTLGVFAAFLVVFFAFVRCSDDLRPARFWMIAATFALGLDFISVEPRSRSTFFVYAAAFLPFSIVSMRRVVAAFLLEVFMVLLGEGWHPAGASRLSARQLAKYVYRDLPDDRCGRRECFSRNRGAPRDSFTPHRKRILRWLPWRSANASAIRNRT